MPRLWPPRSHRFPVSLNAATELTILLKRFRSPRPIGRMYEKLKHPNLFQTRHVFDYDCTYYLPRPVTISDEVKATHVVIMLNGLNEINSSHFVHYDRLGVALAQHGLAAVLHPTPFHLNRVAYAERSKWKQYKRHRGRQALPSAFQQRIWKRHPSVALIGDSSWLASCFDQTAREVRELARQMLNPLSCEADEDRSFYRYFVAPKPKITLLGYSMGGLQALFTYLSDPELFNRCILINSGVNMEHLNPKPVGITSDDWSTLVKTAKRHFAANVREQGIEQADLLRDVLFGMKYETRGFRPRIRDILFISGGADVVARPKFLPKKATEEGLNVFEIAGLGHPLDSDVFDHWFDLLGEAIRRFVLAPQMANRSNNQVLDALLTYEIDGEGWDEWLNKQAPALVFIDPKRDRNIRLDKVISRIHNAQAFLEWYFKSKQFYEDDGALLRDIERRRRSTSSRHTAASRSRSARDRSR